MDAPLFYDGQNMYNRVVLVCTVNVYIPASLGRWLILRYQVLQIPYGMFGLYDFSGSLQNILKNLLNIIDKMKVSDCKEGCVFCFQYLKYQAINVANRCLAVLISNCLQYSIQLTQESVLRL